jgi:hypothetical protein
MARATQQLHALASGVADAHRLLEKRIAHVDSTWSDSARRDFESDHLAAIRGDARQLRDALAGIAGELDRAIRTVEESQPNR